MKLSEVPILDVIKSRVELSKRGKHYYCSCPFHHEDTPSMVVYPNTNSYYCFGCHDNGTPLKFIEKYEKVSKTDAKKILIDDYGVDEELDSIISPKEQKLLDFISFSNIYLNCIDNTNSNTANKYLKTRGINHETIKYFKLGVIQNDISSEKGYFVINGFYPEFNQTLLLSKTSKIINTGFINRVIFPVFDCDNKVAFIGGRSFNNTEPKYIYSENTNTIIKSDFLYNMNNIDHQKEIFVVEGVFDVWALFQNNERNCVSILGSNFSDKQIHMLEKHKKSIYLALDGDSAGKNGTIKLLSESSKIRNNSYVIKLDNLDPYDYYMVKNNKNIIQHAVESNMYLINHLIDSSDKVTVLDRINLVNKVFKIIFQSKNLNSEYLDVLSSALNINKSEIEKKYIEFCENNTIDYEKLLPIYDDYYYIKSEKSAYLVKRVPRKSTSTSSLFVLLIKAIPLDELNNQIDHLDSYSMKSGDNICVFTNDQISQVIEMVEGWENNYGTK